MEKNKRYPSIQTKIFISYGSVFLILILLASGMYYFTSYHTFIRNHTHSSQQLSTIVSVQTEQYFDSVNQLQKKILESPLIRSYVFNDASENAHDKNKQFYETVYTITGYDLPFDHMNMVNLEDMGLVAFGREFGYSDYDINTVGQKNLIQSALELEGKPAIIPPGKGTLYSPKGALAAFSFIRSFPRYVDSLSEPKGIIEIQLDYRQFERLVSSSLESYDTQVNLIFIYDEDGELIYPLGMESELADYYSTVKTAQDTEFENPITRHKEYITSTHSDRTGFTVMAITPDVIFSETRGFYLKISGLIMGISLFLLIIITYHIAKSISLPIVKLSNNISQLQLAALSSQTDYMPHSSLNEVELLSRSYCDMQQRLKESLDAIVQSRTLTLQSQLMALQAQMDSHFLYNTLTIISIMAEENEDFQVSDMCLKLTRMLQYITLDHTRPTTLSQELSHTRNYTDLMSMRFGETIEFSYKTEDNLNGLQIPRLIIQPLVENSVKYSRVPDSVLQISIHLYSDEHYWYGKIRDNGEGFSLDAIQNLFDKTQKLSSDLEYSDLSINGMGLSNIYLRLKLFYDNHFIFEINNLAQGSEVIIGGELNYE